MPQKKIFWSTCIFCLIALAGITQINIVTNYHRLFNPNSDEYQTYLKINESFSLNELVMLTVESKANIFEPDTIALINTLSIWAESLPKVTSVNAITSVILPPNETETKEDELENKTVFEVLEQGNFSENILSQVKSKLLALPYFTDFLLSPDIKSAAIIIEHQLAPNDPNWEHIRDQIISAVNEKIQNLENSHTNLKFNATGTLFFNKAFVDIMERDAVFMPLLLHTFAFLVLWLTFRCWKVVAITFILADLSMLITLGLQGWLNIPITQINSPACVIIMALVLTSLIHVWSGATGPTAVNVVESWHKNKKPIFFTTLTTATGFFSLSICDSLPFRELGYVVATGVLASFMVLYGLIPSLCHLFSLQHLPNHARHSSGLASSWINFSIKHCHIILLVGLTSSVILISLITENELNDSMKEYFPEDLGVLQSAEIMETQFKGMDHFTYSLSPQVSEVLTSPEFLAQIASFQSWLQDQPEVVKVITPLDLVRQVSSGFNQTLSELNSDEIMELLDLYSLDETGEDTLLRYFNFDHHQVRLTIIVKYMTSKENLIFSHRIHSWLNTHAPNIHYQGTGLSTLYALLGMEIIHSMIGGSILALLCITILIALMFRSITIGLMSVLPNLLPPLLLFGGWAIFNGEVNMGIATVFAISFGIIVDDTIHLLSRLNAAQREMPFIEAIRYAFSHVGKAIITSSIMLSLGMFSLTISDFRVTSDMGMMIGAITLIALIFDLVFLPAFLASINKNPLFQAKRAI